MLTHTSTNNPGVKNSVQFSIAPLHVRFYHSHLLLSIIYVILLFTVIDLENEKLVLIEKSGLSLIQPFFFKSSKVHYSVGCVGLQELPYKLGLIYCSNRISFLLGCNVSS